MWSVPLKDDPSKPAEARRVRWLEFVKLSLKFWTGQTRRTAWLITASVVILVGVQLAAQLGVNFWSRSFFDALERKSSTDLEWTILTLPLLVAFNGVAVSGALVARMTLQMRWRAWLTEAITGWWLKDQRYYRLAVAVDDIRAPEYRIACDVLLAIEPLVEFAIGLLTAITSAAAFVGILWSVGGSIKLSLPGSHSIVVQGYLGLAAIAYTMITASLAYLSGRGLVSAVGQKNETEARFLAQLTRLRENAESIALIGGDQHEANSILRTYKEVMSAWTKQIYHNGLIANVQSANGALVPLIPLVLVAPKYLAGSLSLGAVMQVAAAFVSVQVVLNWFVDNFVRVAQWMASAKRVDELVEALEGLDVGVIMDERQAIEFGVSSDRNIYIENLAVAHRNGRSVIASASVVIKAGEKLLVSGESGAGKSTLVRALAGLWPWGSGRILLPEDTKLIFVPQTPYLPLGTLRHALLYGMPHAVVTDDVIQGAMRRCGLGYLIKNLEREERWDQILSGGERQRLAFVRLLIQRPQIIVTDEATSALDEESQASLLRLFNENLSYATVISIGHRAGLEEFHDKKLVLERRRAGSYLAGCNFERSPSQMSKMIDNIRRKSSQLSPSAAGLAPLAPLAPERADGDQKWRATQRPAAG